MEKPHVKSRRLGHPKQIYLDTATKVQFEALVADYDTELTSASAIIKLIKAAIQEWHLPGYVKRDKVEKKTVTNELTNTLNRMEGRKNNS